MSISYVQYVQNIYNIYNTCYIVYIILYYTVESASHISFLFTCAKCAKCATCANRGFEKSDPSTTKNFFSSSLFSFLALSCQAIFFEILCRAHNVIDPPGRLRKPNHLLTTSKTSNHRALSHTTALVAANSVKALHISKYLAI